MSIEKILNSNTNKLKINLKHLSTDVKVYPINIKPVRKPSNEILSKVRKSHEVNINDKILLFLDFKGQSIFSSKYSILFLENEISFSGDIIEDYKFKKISYEDIKDVKIIEKSVIFYFDRNKKKTNYQINIEEEDIPMWKIICNFIKVISNKFNNPINKLITDGKLYFKTNEFKKALQKFNTVLKIDPFNPIALLYKSRVLTNANNLIESLKVLDKAAESIKKSGSSKDLLIEIKYYRGVVEELMGDYYKSAWSFIEGRSLIRDADEIKKFEDKLKIISDHIEESILKFDYDQRKIIYCFSDNIKKMPKTFVAVKKEWLSKLIFPIGHPMNGNQYIASPVIPNQYYLLEEFSLRFLEHKSAELVNILECLGAKSLKIKVLKGDLSKIYNLDEININIGGKYKGVGANINSENKKTKQRDSEENVKIIHNDEYLPNGIPHLPENLIWYKNEVTWQTLVAQRLNGNILKSSIYLSSNMRNFISEDDYSKIQAEINVLVLKSQGSYKKNTSYKKISKQNIEWEIEVEFFPKENLQKDSASIIKLN